MATMTDSRGNMNWELHNRVCGGSIHEHEGLSCLLYGSRLELTSDLVRSLHRPQRAEIWEKKLKLIGRQESSTRITSFLKKMNDNYNFGNIILEILDRSLLFSS